MFKLLTRDLFREQCLERDGHKCLFCDCTGSLSVHHIYERKLWENGGYYLENGATLCDTHHIEAEQTVLSCDEIRIKANIKKFPLPEHLESDQVWDKWANPILPNGMRLKGELFYDESVQSVLEPVLHLFTCRVKYPRTYHVNWSNPSKDDKIQDDLSELENAEKVVVTVKQDGENTTMYNDYIHARSLDYKPHDSRSWVKTLHARVKHNIPDGWRVCGENLFAKHSIKYENLDNYFQVFSIWTEKNECLSWDDTLEWTEMLDLTPVPTLYYGSWNEKLIKSLYQEKFNNDVMEGYVVRVARSFHYKHFRKCLVKYVRKNHVTCDTHWATARVEPNILKVK